MRSTWLKRSLFLRITLEINNKTDKHSDLCKFWAVLQRYLEIENISENVLCSEGIHLHKNYSEGGALE